MSDQTAEIKGRASSWRATLWAAGVAVVVCTAEVMACSVCQGDPDSKLVKGAEAGVLLMVFVTYGLLLGMVGLGVTWFVRQRRNLARAGVGAQGAEDQPTGDA